MGVFLLSLAVKGSVVLALGAAVASLLRRGSASLRHGVWAATFVALLAVPVFDAAGPSWRVAVLPSVASAPSAAPLARSAEVGSRPSISGSAVSPAPVRSVGSAERTAVTPGSVVMWLSRLWVLGVLAVGLGWLRGVVLGRRLVRASRAVDGEVWSMRVHDAARAVGLRQPVRLRQSDALSVPVAWGWGRPTVVLPPQSGAWDAERARSVLLHEMAHLRRRDAWTQGLAQAALALHWPNPLAWLAYRRFLTAREQACDDAVLGVGAPPTTYASHLVAAARELSPSRLRLAAVSPLIGPDELETRVRAILDGRRRRGPVGRWVTGAALMGAVAVGGPLAAFQPVAGQDSQSANDRRQAEREDAREASIPPSSVQASTADIGAPRTEPMAALVGGTAGETADQTDTSIRRDTVDVPLVEREAARVRRASDAVDREDARIRREADTVDREAAQVRRDADAVEREAARVERQVDAARREADHVRREADAVGREKEQIRRQAHEAEREAARLQREARVIEDTSWSSSSWPVSTEASPTRPPPRPPSPS